MLCLSVFILTLAFSYIQAACNIQVQGVDKKAQDMIVKKHNELRSKVALGKQKNLPEASNMLEMVWDDKVAAKSQEWANKCKYEDDTKEDRDTGRGYTGENIAFRSNQDKSYDWDEVIEDFYSEVSDFDPGNIDGIANEEATGHFTQIIWANSTKIGCGYVRFLDTKIKGNYYHLYGCEYLPGGNIEDYPIYKRGKPCSECSTSTCGSTPGLCAPPSSPTYIYI